MLIPQIRTFVKQTPEGIHRLRILWSYSDNGAWEGPDNHKFYYSGRPALYKVYLISPVHSDDLSVESSQAAEFATIFMPVLNDSLFGSASSPDDVADTFNGASSISSTDPPFAVPSCEPVPAATA